MIGQVRSALDQRPHDLSSASGRQVPAPSLGQELNQHETATAFVIEIGLVRLWQLKVLVPHFHERRLPVGREPEMDAGQAVLIGVVRALVLVHRRLNGVGDKLGDNQFNRVG